MDRDFFLTDKGRQQAHACGGKLQAAGVCPDVIYCSRLTRARQTAEIISQYVPAPVHAKDNLIEHGSGVFLLDGSIEEAARQRPDALLPDGTLRTVQGARDGLNWEFAVGGEDLRALHRRAAQAWREIVDAFPGEGGTYLVVAHGCFLSAILTEGLGLPLRAVWNFQFPNAGCLHLRFFHAAPGGAPLPVLCVDGPDQQVSIK